MRTVLLALVLFACHSHDPEPKDRPPETPSTKPVTKPVAKAKTPREGWTLAIGGTRSRINRIALAPDGGFCVVGFFSGTIRLGDKELTAVGSGDNMDDGFVACYASDRSLRWEQVLSGPGTDEISDLAIGAHGEVVIIGNLGFTDAGTPHLSADLAGTKLQTTGKNHLCVARFAADGALAWAHLIGDPGNNTGAAIAIAPDGKIAIGGKSYGPVDLAGVHYDNESYGDSFVAGLGADGEPTWVVPLAPKGWDAVSGLLYAADGNLYAVGSFSATMPVGKLQLTSAGDADGFVIGLGRDGSVKSARSLGGPGADGVSAIAADGKGGFVIAGYFARTLTFGKTSATARGDNDGFVASLGADGSEQWFTRFGGDGRDDLRSLAVSATTIYAAGTTSENFKIEHRKEVPGVPVTVLGKMNGAVAGFTLAGQQAWVRPTPSPNGLGLFDAVVIDRDEHIYASGATNNTGVVLQLAW